MERIDNSGWKKEDDIPEKKADNAVQKESKIKGRFRWLKAIVVIMVILLLFYLFFYRTWLLEYHCSRRAKCLSNIKQIGLAMKQYALDNDEIFPWDTSTNKPTYRTFGKLHPSYASALEVFRCPDSSDEKWDRNTAHENRADGALFTTEACKKSLSYACSHKRGKPWTENDRSEIRLVADKYANQDYTDDLFPKGRPINHWSRHLKTDPGRNIVRLDGSAGWDNSRKPLEADPEKDVNADHPDAKHDPANDQAGTDWWSDPPDK